MPRFFKQYNLQNERDAIYFETGVTALEANSQDFSVTLADLMPKSDYLVHVTMQNRNTALPLATDSIATISGQPTVTIPTAGEHGLIIGSVVTISGVVPFAGLLTGDLNGAKTVTAVPSTTSFSFNAGANANATGTGGGSAATWTPPVDAIISVYSVVLTTQQRSGFSFKLNDTTGSANYKAHWRVESLTQ